MRLMDFRIVVVLWRRHILRLYNDFLKFFFAVFAKRTFKIVGEFVALVNVAAHLAHPATFAVLGVIIIDFGLGLDMPLVIVVGHGRLVGKHLGIKHFGDEHGVSAEINALADTASQIGVGVFRDVKDLVHSTMFGFASGEFVRRATRLEAEMLEDEHRRLGGQHRNVEDARRFDEFVRIVSLVDRNDDLQRRTGDLQHRVHDAAVVDAIVAGGQDVKSITDVEQCVGVHGVRIM